jgi:hypothetical protein
MLDSSIKRALGIIFRRILTVCDAPLLSGKRSNA